MNPYRFENQNREIVLSRYNMPTPWMNYLSNGTLHAMISQAGGGVAWYKSPQIWRINHYRFFHLPTDRSGFYTYIKDGDSVWCPTSEPCACKPEKWEAAHGMGYTRFTAERDGLRTEVTYLVSPLKNVMLWHLELRSDRDRDVTIYPYVELGMMEFMRELQWQCYNKHQLSVYEKDGVLIYRYGVENQPKPDETPLVYFASDVPAAGFDCDRDEFIGSYRSEEAPVGLEHEHLKNSTLFGGDPCFALELPLTLRAGETKSLNIYLGTEMTESEISKSLAACKAPDFFSASMQKLAETWEDFFSGFQCSLPDKDAETMINIWNPYQMERNFRFSRNISYYATGTFRGVGVRDTAQDVLAMIPLQLDRAKEKFELLLTQQYQDGHCNHYFFPTEGWEPVTRVHSDNHLWLVMDAYHIALEEGNVSYLDTQAPYFDGGSGTIWEHIKQSIRFTTQNMGAHGFPLMLSSDWNDMLYKVCRKGKGESIWTGMQFAVALRMMQELAERMGEPEFAEECKALYARQQALCRTVAWDGAWFRRAYDAFGKPVGSKECTEGQIFIEPQGMCVMAGIGKESGQAAQALASVEERLDTKYGVVLLQPAYTSYQLNLGEISSYPPGYKENAGIFCHNNPWISCAEATLGHGDRAFAVYRKTCPAYIEDISEIHRTEPYVYSQMVAGKDAPTFGEAKNSWLTGTAAWTFFNISQYILGIQPTLDGLKVDPCIPHTLSGFTVTRRFRGAVYHITVDNAAGVQHGIKAVTVDGKAISGNVLPLAAAGTEVTVQVTMG